MSSTAELLNWIDELKGVINLVKKYSLENEMIDDEMLNEAKLFGLGKLDEIAEIVRQSEWVPVGERLPEPEKRVLVCAETRCADGKKYRHITTAMYEDGMIWREDSDWNFNEFDNLEKYDKEKDDWKIPEGWWEYTIYNDDEGNYPIDDFVTHWRPLPQSPKGDG